MMDIGSLCIKLIFRKYIYPFCFPSYLLLKKEKEWRLWEIRYFFRNLLTSLFCKFHISSQFFFFLFSFWRLEINKTMYCKSNCGVRKVSFYSISNIRYIEVSTPQDQII
jgi:hypothetical protein